MLAKDNCYLVPASPELRAKFLRTRELLLAGEPLVEEATIDVTYSNFQVIRPQS